MTHGSAEDFAGTAPGRPPHWRLDLARQIANGELRNPGPMSPALAAAVAHLSGERGHGQADADGTDAARTAIKICEADDPIRWAIEAYLLAGLGNEEISDRTDVASDVIELYEQVCFRVRDGLNASDYNMAKVVELKHISGFGDHDVRQFWAWAGCSDGGPRFVDTLVQTMRQVLRPGERPKLSMYLRPDSAVPVALQGLIAINVMPSDGIAAKWASEYQLQLAEAMNSRDPRSAFAAVRQTVIAHARMVLAGECLPKPPQPKRHETVPSSSMTNPRVQNSKAIVPDHRSSTRFSI